MKIQAIEEGFSKVVESEDNLEDNRTMDLPGEDKEKQKGIILDKHKGVKIILTTIGVAIFGVTLGLLIMNILKVNEQKLQIEDLTLDLKLQQDRGNDLELENGNLVAKYERVKSYMMNSIFGSTEVGEIEIDLLEASENGKTEAVQVLLELGLDANTQNENKWTPLHFAAWNGYPKIAEILLQNGAEVNIQTNYPQTWSNNGEMEAFLMGLSKGLNQSTPLHFAAQRGHLEVAKLLIQNQADIYVTNADFLAQVHNETALDLASNHGHLKVVELLLQTELQIKNLKFDYNSISAATYLGHLEVVKMLLENGADINEKSGKSEFTPLHMAAIVGNDQMTEFLLQNGADVNARNNLNSTALELASSNGYFEVVEILLNNGAETDIINGNNWTALEKAVMYRHVKVVEILLKHGAKIRQETYFNLTCYPAPRSTCGKIKDLLSTYQ